MTDPFAIVRQHCLAIDGVTEKLSHSSPSFFAKGTPSKAGPCFVMCHDDHHGDGILGLWVAAPAGAQEAAIAEEPEVFYRPAYVGNRGWIGIRLDRDLPQEELLALLTEAHDSVRRR